MSQKKIKVDLEDVVRATINDFNKVIEGYLRQTLTKIEGRLPDIEEVKQHCKREIEGQENRFFWRGQLIFTAKLFIDPQNRVNIKIDDSRAVFKKEPDETPGNRPVQS